MFSQKKIYDVIFILNSSSENGSNSNSHPINIYIYSISSAGDIRDK
jgi:hypothetical protein